ncbi:MAG: hypothetical protein K0U68_11810 [Gammaproteobacteria bacterium]|nr:hypothetical protein [Gammaproteobacteria bacterium]
MDNHLVTIAGLLDNGEGRLAIETYDAVADDIDGDVRQQILNLFGLAVLAGIPGLEEQQLTVEPGTRDIDIAQQALQAYCRNDDQTSVRKCLKQLPFQSVFKDFRILLSNLLQQESSQSAQNQFSILPENSPFHLLAEQISLHSSLHNHSELARKFLLDAEQWLELPNAKQALFWLIEHQQFIQPHIFNKLLINLLLEYPEGLDDCHLHIKYLDEFQRSRIKALTSERIADYEQAAHWWESCAECLDTHSNQSALLEKQLLYQRIEYCHEQLGELSVDNQIQRLEHCIQDIPENPELVLKLLNLYRADTRQQQYRALLNRAIKQFPTNTAIIAAAVANATETAEFDQAAELAEQLFVSDSLNVDSRQSLIQSYFNYSSRLILRGQRYAAETLLARIEQLERPAASGLVPVYKALLNYVSGDDVAAERFVEQACQQSGSYLLSYLRMAIETGRLGFKSKYSKKYLKLIQSLTTYQPTVQELFDLLAMVKNHVDAETIQLSQVWPMISPFVNRISDDGLQLEQLLKCCEILKELELYEDVYQLAGSANRADLDSEWLQFYRVYGQTQANPARLNAEDTVVLEQILDQHAEYNPDVCSEIIEFLNSNLNTSAMLPGQWQQSTGISGSEHDVDMNPDDLLNTVKQLFKFKS